MRGWEPRPITVDEIDVFRTRISEAFGSDPSEDDEARERFEKVFPLERTVAVFDDEDLIGTGAAFTFDLTIPGGSIPIGGTTVISVRPTHRRQGVLNAMMDHHLHEVADRREPVAALWASEGAIYRRFGYGLASLRVDTELDAPKIVVSDAATSAEVRLLDQNSATPHLKAVYEAVADQVPGMISRSREWWDVRVVGLDKPSQGFTKRRYAVATHDGAPVGYVIYRQKLDWSSDEPVGKVRVIELMSSAPGARVALWRFLTSIDLFTKVSWWNTPIDEPLAAMVTDPMQVTGKTKDGLWVRILDIEQALSARTYEYDGMLNIGVTDPFRSGNDGTYRLEISGGDGKCVRTDDEPDVSCEIDVLGHLYLGGGNAVAMSAAGRVTGRDEYISILHRVFRTDGAPWCPEVF